MQDVKDSAVSGLDRKLGDLAARLEERKAIHARIHKLSDPNAIADAFIIVSASSRRHAQGLAEGVLAACRENGHEFLRMEGFDVGQWILVDCNDVIVHIFQEGARDLYRLDELWRCLPNREK